MGYAAADAAVADEDAVSAEADAVWADRHRVTAHVLSFMSFTAQRAKVSPLVLLHSELINNKLINFLYL